MVNMVDDLAYLDNPIDGELDKPVSRSPRPTLLGKRARSHSKVALHK
jgi:hypothetical protein